MSNEDRTASLEYRPIEGFPGYGVTEEGDVCSRWERFYPSDTRGVRYSCGSTWRPLKTMVYRGYHRVSLRRDGKSFPGVVHILVLEAFVGPRPPGTWGLHKDDDRSNNQLSNLYWGTPAQNTADRIRNGHFARGEDVTGAKLTSDAVREIREAYAAGGVLQRELAAKYGVAQAIISHITRGAGWSHVDGKRTLSGKPRKRLDAETIERIKAMSLAGLSQQKIADDLGIGQATVSRILRDSALRSTP